MEPHPLYLNYFHEKEYKSPSLDEWEKMPLEEGFCHESHCSKSSFSNCLNPIYLEWKRKNAMKEIK